MSKQKLTRREILTSAGALGVGLGVGGAVTGQGSARPGGEGQGGEPASLIAFAGAVERGDGLCVGFPLYKGVTLLDFAGATQVFKFAGLTPVWLAAQNGPIETTEGVSVLPTHTFNNHPKLDVLFVPGGGPDGVIAAMFDPVFRRFLSQAARQASWSGSVCVGAFILAAARLLDGCRATTYWSQIPNLQLLREKMKIEVAPEYPRRLIDSERRRFTGGGVSSSIDLALELVEVLTKSREVAQRAQLAIQYAPGPHIHAGDPSDRKSVV